MAWMRHALFLSAVATLAVATPDSGFHLAKRGAGAGYAPQVVQCPSGLSIRTGSTLNADEAAYVLAKGVESLPVWTEYLTRIGIEDFNVSSFVPSSETAVGGSTLPMVGFAVGGGGVRSMLVGGGMLAAFDNRNATSVAAGTGGVLQLAQYMSALSGSSWLVGSYVLADFSTFEYVRDKVWRLVEGGFNIPKTINGFHDAVSSIRKKAAAGSPVSLTDALGRTLAYHLFEYIPSNSWISYLQQGPGAGTLWSSIKTLPSYLNHTAPFPIILATGREKGNINATIESPIVSKCHATVLEFLSRQLPQYEITPYHFGTNVPNSGGLYVPIESLGTKFRNGTPANAKSCVERFDNAGFMMACSGNVFGETAYFVELSAGIELSINATAIADDTGINEALAVPTEYIEAGRGEVVPFFPLVQPQRKLDVFFAIDSSTDRPNHWPDGTEIWNSYRKSLLPGYEAIAFPVIPDPNTFVSLGFNVRPTFFGSSCYSQPNNVTTPLIVYLPNYHETFASNTSTLTTTYSVADQLSFYDNSFQIVTQRLSTTWPVDAQQERNGVARTSQCEACFEKYCYMG
ncbi:hypothetical protein RQP46_003712 [Phenoliferia psychrophenolica]